MQRLRTSLGITALCAAVFALSSCSPFAGVDDGTVELTLLTLDGGDDNIVLEDVIDAFEAQNEGVTVNATYVPEDTYATKLQTAMLADAPDIASTYGWDSLFGFLPLNDIVYADNDIPLSGFNAALENFCSWEGDLYCVGTTVGNMVTFYNTDLYDAAGVAYPDAAVPMTYDELAEVAAQLTQPGASDADTVFGAAPGLLLAYLDPANVLDDTGRIVEVTDPEFVDTAETLVEMVERGDAPSDAQAEALGGGDGAMAMFLDGKVATMIADNFAIDAIEAAGIDYGLAPTPVVAGNEPWVVTWTNAFGIPAKADHPDEAAAFLAFMATEGQALQADYGLMPMNTEIATTWANTPQRQQLLEITSLARPGVFNPNQWAWNSPIIDALGAAMRGEPLMPLLEDAQPKAQQANDTTWEIFDQAVAANEAK